MLNLLGEKKRIINLDQTPIGQSTFDQRGWIPKDILMNLPHTNINPRITMIAAVDNFGKVYYALL